MKLATLNADGRLLDFGVSFDFDPANGMRAIGRADNPKYVGAFFEKIKSGDVTLSDVPDNYALPGPAPAKQFISLSSSQFIAMLVSVLGMARVDQLIAKSKSVETLIVMASKIDRLSGNTPKAIQYLMTGANALTQVELDAIDTAWGAMTNA